MEKVEMTAEERREFEAFRAEKKKKKPQSFANYSVPPTSKWSMTNWPRQSRNFAD